MTTSYPTVSLTATTWVNLVVANPALANVDVLVYSRGPNPVLAFFSASSTAPGVDDGIPIRSGDAFQGNAANIWVKGDGVTRAAAVAV